MKASVLLLLAALTASALAQTCPQDAKVGNPINYAHLFKEQTDFNWDFYNTRTASALIFQDSTNIPIGGSRHRIVFRVSDDNLPKRAWLYMVNVRYDANAYLSQIDGYAKVRSDGSNITDLPRIMAFFSDTSITLAAAPGNCCLAKLEYINFYYLFAQYYKDGSGLTKPACT